MFGLALLGVLLAHSLRHIEVDPLRCLDVLLYDLRVRWFATAPVDERIVIVDFDQRSLAELGLAVESEASGRPDRADIFRLWCAAARRRHDTG